MISLFIKFLPYVFVLYFLFRALKEPVFLIGIPFLMFLRSSIFFDRVELFRMPIRSFKSIEQNPDIFLLVYLIIFWLIFRIRSNDSSEIEDYNPNSIKNTSILDYYIFSLMAITVIGFGIVLNEYYANDQVFDQFYKLIGLFLGYFIIKDVVRRTNINVLEEFLFNIVIINTIASGLYFVHQGLHIQLYDSQKNEYLVTVFEGQVITRTFWFMPVLWFLSISYLLIFKRTKSIINILLLSINMLGIYISYTRSFLMLAVFIFILYFVLTGFKNRNFGNSVKSIFVVGVASFALFIAVSNFLPASTNYFLSRFKELDEKPVDAHSNNLVYRFYKTEKIMDRMASSKTLFGYGPVTESLNPFVKIVAAATADMGWAEVVFRWGFLGFIFFILLYITSVIKAFFLFIRTDGIVSQLALLLLLTIVSQIIEGFTSFTIMSPNRFALGLWYFGFLSALILYNKNQENAKKEIFEN